MNQGEKEKVKRKVTRLGDLKTGLEGEFDENLY